MDVFYKQTSETHYFLTGTVYKPQTSFISSVRHTSIALNSQCLQNVHRHGLLWNIQWLQMADTPCFKNFSVFRYMAHPTPHTSDTEVPRRFTTLFNRQHYSSNSCTCFYVSTPCPTLIPPSLPTPHTSDTGTTTAQFNTKIGSSESYYKGGLTFGSKVGRDYFLNWLFIWANLSTKY